MRDGAGIDERVLDALAGESLRLDALARRCGVSASELAPRVARLVVRGEISAAGDGRLARR